MCQVYNRIGSLVVLKDRLEANNISDLKSIYQVIEFKENYHNFRNQLIQRQQEELRREKEQLADFLIELERSLDSQRKALEVESAEGLNYLEEQIAKHNKNKSNNILNKIYNWISIQIVKSRIAEYKKITKNRLQKSLGPLELLYDQKSSRHRLLVDYFAEALRESTEEPLTELKRKKDTIDSLSSFIYGAIGEHKVVKTLEGLSDDFYLINDFKFRLRSPLFYKQDRSHIRSIQLDHILVAPSGIFLIETKNWSKESVERISLRSPIDQIRRSGYVIYKLLNSGIGNDRLHLDDHHWGKKKSVVHNIIVMINHKPTGEFQYVKILLLNELLDFLKWKKPIYSKAETEKIKDFLLSCCEG